MTSIPVFRGNPNGPSFHPSAPDEPPIGTLRVPTGSHLNGNGGLLLGTGVGNRIVGGTTFRAAELIEWAKNSETSGIFWEPAESADETEAA